MNINNINLTEFKTDYLNCMLAEDIKNKYGINHYYFVKLRKKLGLNRGAVDKTDYVLKVNQMIPNEPNEEHIKPNIPKPNIPKPNIPKPNITKPNITKPNITKPNIPKIPKSTINIKTINTDNDVNITEIKKCDTTYNNDKSELMEMLKNADVAIKKSKKTLNKNNVV